MTRTFDTPVHAHHGDCVPFLQSIPAGTFDMVLTDPPYGIAYKTAHRAEPHRFAQEIANDRDLSIVEAVAPHLQRVLKDDAACFVFCAWKRQDEVARIIEGAGLAVKNRIVWDKGTTTAGDLKGAFGYQYEVLLFAAKGNPAIRGKRHPDIWRHMRVSADKLHHQNEKPVPLLEQAILAMSDPGDTVLDPFMGSGSTGVACLNCGRNFVGCEIDPGYFDVARKRLDAESAQGRMFAGLC